MITIKSALAKVLQSDIKTPIESIDLIESLNHVLAEDLFSMINMPPFNQSAMDGYAVCGEADSYKIVGEIQAGDTARYSLNRGEAFRIFTGAMTPDHTLAIAKQEITKVIDGQLILQEKVKAGTSIRLEGEEIAKGNVVLSKGTKITPAAIGLLAGFGFESVRVFAKPKITLIVTGNELTKPGHVLVRGKIFESNSFTIKSAIIDSGFTADVKFVKDDFESTKETINEALLNSNLVIMTGGISVGDYDYVGKALNELGVEQKFYKVNQKPGKPLYYGEKGAVKVFALPGNPAAALTCFYVYVLSAIKTMLGINYKGLERRVAIINHDHLKKGDRAHLLKAQINNGEVSIHKGQSSAMLSSYVDANCLLFLDGQTNQVKRGEQVEVLLLP